MTSAVTPEDRQWLTEAARQAHLCPPSESAFSVGAVIVDGSGRELARGHSRDTDPLVHAEESALARLPSGDPRLRQATLYSSLEPCSQRASRPCSCTQLILTAGIPRVVIAWREPENFVADCQGKAILESQGVTVLECPEVAALAKAPNGHLLGGGGGL